MVCVQVHTKVFQNSVNRHRYIVINAIKLTNLTQIYKNMLSMKSGLSNINVSCAGLYKNFRVHHGLYPKMTGSVFSIELYFLLDCIKLLCDAYNWTQCTGLLKSNRIYCLLFNITDESYF